MCQNHSHGPFLCKYWWHDFKSWILGRKVSFITDFLKWQENEEKTMICEFFKLKLIAWVDFRVVLMFYSFQVIWVDLDGEFEKLTKYAQIWKYSKSMSPDFDSLYQWKNSSPPLCATHIRKGLDLLFHLVCPESIVWYKDHNKITIWKKYRFPSKFFISAPIPIVN